MNIHTKDFRILLTKVYTVLAFIFCVIGTAVADISGEQKAILTFIYAALAGTAFAGFHLLRNKKTEVLIFMLMTVYIWVAHPIKLTLTLIDPMTSWVSYETFPAKIVQGEIASYYLIIAPALLALFWGIISGYKASSTLRNIAGYRVNHIAFTFAIISLLALRFINQTVLQIGLPGVRPQVLPIPYLTGILELISRPVLFALVNLYFYSILKLNESRGLWLALFLVLVNIVLGLWVGYKSELVLQCLFLIYYVFGLQHHIPATRRRTLYGFGTALIVCAIVLYPLINYYRFSLLSGKDISQAVDRAAQMGERYEHSFFFSFINRINGIDAFYAAAKLGEGQEFPLSSLMDASVMDLIKEQKYGLDKDKAVTAFGTTQFSVLYLVGGVGLLYVGSLAFGWMMTSIASILRRSIYKSPLIFEAYLPFYCIWCIKLLSSGGELALYLKELLLVALFLFLAERYGLTKSRRRLRTSGAVDIPPSTKMG